MGATASVVSTVAAAKEARNVVKDALTPKIPAQTPAQAPPLPTPAEIGAAQSAAQQQQRRRALAAYGRSNTILTGPLGLQDAAVGVRKTLLGT